MEVPVSKAVEAGREAGRKALVDADTWFLRSSYDDHYMDEWWEWHNETMQPSKIANWRFDWDDLPAMVSLNSLIARPGLPRESRYLDLYVDLWNARVERSR